MLAGLLAFTVAVSGLTSGCAVRGRVAAKQLSLSSEPVEISTPVKAHLLDGSTIVFATGAAIGGGVLRGTGTQYDLTLTQVGTVSEVPLDRILALETFEETSEKGLTALASGGVAALTVAAVGLLAVAIFGSCPTVYSDGEQLEAELFSNSIAPIFELPDVDRLTIQSNAEGVVELDIRNEALETHYLNHLSLVEIEHSPDEIVVTDEENSALALNNFIAAEKIVDRNGRDLRAELEAEDNRVFRTDPATLREAKLEDFEDSIELWVPVPPGRDSVALLFRLRNSLLSTVLLYDVMLSGPQSVNWLGNDLGQTKPALELAAWYSSRMGMHVEVWEDGAYRRIARVRDTGPIAWKDVAVVVPASPGDRLRVRLKFVADNWRIDKLSIAADVRKPTVRAVPIEEVMSKGIRDPAASRSLHSVDQQYLKTTPGQSFRARFDVGVASERSSRTFLLNSQGYYSEWIRRAWIENGMNSGPFTPGDDSLMQAIGKWREVQPEFEAQFHATRLPVQ